MRALLVLLLACPAFATTARAQTDAHVAESPLPERLLSDALAEYELGNWSGAQALLTRVHALQPSARTRRGLGYVAFNLRQFARALAELDASLRDPIKPLDPTLRAQVAALMARAEPNVARVRLRLRPAHAHLSIDGALPQRDGQGQLLLDLGLHVLHVEAPGFSPLERQVAVHDNQRFDLSLALTPRPLPMPAAAHPLRVRRFSWVLAISSLVTAIAATAVWLVADRRYDRLERECRAQGGCFARALHAQEVQRLDRASWGLWGATGALALSATATWIWTAREAHARPSAAPITQHAPHQLARAKMEIHTP